MLHSLSALHRGERLDLLVGTDGALSGWSRMTSVPMHGDAYETVRMHSAIDAAGFRLPARVTRSLRGLGLVADLELISAARSDFEPRLLERPPDRNPPAADEESPPDETADARPATVTDLGHGAFLIPVPGNPDYRSLVIERPDHLVLVEAPVGEEATRALLELVAQRFGDKPLRWVVATHHHFDHSAGVPAALETGATLVTTPGNSAFFRRAVRGPHTLQGRTEPPGPPTIRAVAERWLVPGEAPTVEVLPVAPTEHAREMLVVHLPEAKLLFQGDLIRFPLPADQPLRPQVEALWSLLETRAPTAERIAGVHGEVGTVDELRERLGD